MTMPKSIRTKKRDRYGIANKKIKKQYGISRSMVQAGRVLRKRQNSIFGYTVSCSRSRQQRYTKLYGSMIFNGTESLNVKKVFCRYFSNFFLITCQQAHHLQSKKFNFLLKVCVKILFCRHYPTSVRRSTHL
jgi:hypothetical protein